MLPTLGLCVIVKNGAATIRGCLESARGLVDASVVVDTGSTDATAAIAEQCGARLVPFAWRGDFASARNAALAAIGTDWVLVLDADEELDGAARAWIRTELAAPRAEGYVVPVRNYLKPWDRPLTGAFPIPPGERHPQAPDAELYIHSEVVRLFRRDPTVYYQGPIHEQVEYRLIELGRPIARAGFFIHHFGWYAIDAEGLKRKYDLYYELLRMKAAERPRDPQVLMQYGDALCSWRGEHQAGLDCFLKAAALGGRDPVLWLSMAIALHRLGHHEAALAALGQVPDRIEFAGTRARFHGEMLAALRRWPEARAALEEACRLLPESIPLVARLALVEMECGDEAAGLARMQGVIGRAEAQARKHGEALPYLYAAELHAQIRQWPEALRLAEAGILIDPKLAELHELALKAAVATHGLARAAEAARQIAILKPAPRSFLRHTAVLCQIGNQEAAGKVIARALEQFPGDDAVQAAGRELGVGVPVPA